MRASSSVQSLCRWIKTPLFFSSSKNRSVSEHCNGFVFSGAKLSRKVHCHSLSSSDELHTPITFPANLLEVEEKSTSDNDAPKWIVLKEKAETLGLVYDDSCVPGCFYNLLCPKCKGGDALERSLSFHIVQKGDAAMWRCFRSDCGWAGRVFAEIREAKRKIRSPESLTEESLGLTPLSDELLAYLRERMISKETLLRNKVMQVSDDKGVAMAFTYRREGVIVSCKYRTVEKRFWREKDTEKIFYGLDDIIDSDEIIIVEGELDKLSMEEAGFRNCVSVPDGAPFRVSGIVPPPEMDTKFSYIWNCLLYLDKASRIILATDADKPGQSLAEELARRIGKHRCWQVSWPKKDEFSCFKDANEVLMCLGPSALKNTIKGAELYPQFTAIYNQE